MSGLTLENFRVGTDNVEQIGATNERPGVLRDLRTAFGYSGDSLDGLIKHVAPNTTLQDNIEFAREVLSDEDTAKSIGYEGDTAASIAGDICARSGLQARVIRPFMEPAEGGLPSKFDAAIQTDGVVNWMDRMTNISIMTARQASIDTILLASGGRLIGDNESPKVAAGTSVNRYMATSVVPMMGISGLFKAIELVHTNEKAGPKVMAQAAGRLAMSGEVDLTTGLVIVPAVAGNWPQKGAQARQALKAVQPDFDSDPERRQLWVVSDSFPLGLTGEEPKTTHQNPFSALGNVLRAAKLLDDQAKIA